MFCVCVHVTILFCECVPQIEVSAEGEMARPRSNLVWLKRRKNPPKSDGKHTVSFTLQYRDGTGRERFLSLGTKVTEEEAEKAREQLQRELTGPWSIDPAKFCQQFRRRYPVAYELLCRLHNVEVTREEDDESLTTFVQEVVIPRWKRCAPHALALKLLRLAEGAEKGWVAEPETLLRQLEQRMPVEYRVLVDYCEGSRKELLHLVEIRCIFDDPESVVSQLLEIVEKEGWSREKFVEQFKKRYPEEYGVVSEYVSLARKIKKLEKQKPLSLVALELIEFARNRMARLEDTGLNEQARESHPSFVAEDGADPNT